MADVKIESIVVDTFTGIQKNEILEKWQVGKATQDDWKDYGVDIVAFIRNLSKRGFEVVGILGYEGTGKSYGMKHLPNGTNIWYNADGKNPTWKGGNEIYGNKTSPTKFMQIPISYDKILSHIDVVKKAGAFSDNPVAFVIGHIEDYKSEGKIRQKLSVWGKLAAKMRIEDMFENCYYTEIFPDEKEPSKRFQLRVQNSGSDTCRTKEELHSSLYINNDFRLILEALRNY